MNVCPESPGWGELMNWGELDADRWRALVNGTAGDRAIVYAGHEIETTTVTATDESNVVALMPEVGAFSSAVPEAIAL